MRLLASLVAFSKAHQVIESSWNELNQEWIDTNLEDLDSFVVDDMKFTPCQADLYSRKGISIPDEIIEPGEGQLSIERTFYVATFRKRSILCIQ